SVFVIRRLKKRKHIFWRKTNMLLFSDLSFRMKDNARTFFMVAIISTVAFSAIGTLYGFQSYTTKGLSDVTPYTFIYNSMEDDGSVKEEDVDFIEETLDKYNIDTRRDSMKETYFNQHGDRILIIDESTYNRISALTDEDEVHLSNDEAITVKDSSRVVESQQNYAQLHHTQIELEHGKDIKSR